ncbi:hypothetical protein NHX12_001399 [Muraenolepis orangiensis]|uniref:Uncharacterized protein n=1 Tax=Muraenolepis orangiensis TaxID=630683 RepID=A0A9Q0IH83_9TELE|nr:hypothetical protein NHX12_001399 [Muraenolepis orangiensis]
MAALHHGAGETEEWETFERTSTGRRWRRWRVEGGGGGGWRVEEVEGGGWRVEEVEGGGGGGWWVEGGGGGGWRVEEVEGGGWRRWRVEEVEEVEGGGWRVEEVEGGGWRVEEVEEVEGGGGGGWWVEGGGGSSCQSGLLPALMRPSLPMIQPSLGGLKQYLPFPIGSASATAASLFPGFSVPARYYQTIINTAIRASTTGG